MARKIYLSGKITGDDGFAERFAKYAQKLSSDGDMVFNPAVHPDMFTHGQFMQLDLLALSFCDTIYLMSNWRSSKGAKMEFDQARVLGLAIEFEEPLYQIRNKDGMFYNVETKEYDISLDDLDGTNLYNKEEIEKINEVFFNGFAEENIVSVSELFETKDISNEKIIEKSVEPIDESLSSESVKLSEQIPNKTAVAYKVFYLKDGKLYPPMVKNPGGSDTPMGVWLDASAGPVAGTTKTGRPQIEKGGEGTHCSKGTLAYRPGWHLGEVPIARQFEKVNPLNGQKELFPKEFVWAECEYSCDNDYQQEAMDAGKTENGSFRHSYAGLQHVPENGSYRYRTNPDPQTEEWIITGKMKVNRILSDREVDELCIKAGKTPQKREKDYLKEIEEFNKLPVRLRPVYNRDDKKTSQIEKIKGSIKRSYQNKHPKEITEENWEQER